MGELGDLIQTIESSIKEELKADGFKRRGKYGILTASIDGNTYGWLGLNRATYKAEKVVLINPVIGIHNKKMWEIYDELLDYDGAKNWIATFGRPLGYYMPENTYRTWEFFHGKSIKPGVKDIVSNVRKYGIPWMKKLCNLEYLADTLEKYNAIDYNIFQLPLVWFLAGDREKAFTCANKYLERRKGDDELLDRYNNFITKLADWELE
jgi:hypothetical protein